MSTPQDDITRYIEDATIDNEVFEYAVDDHRAYESWAWSYRYKTGYSPIGDGANHSFFVLKRNGKLRVAKSTDFERDNVLVPF